MVIHRRSWFQVLSFAMVVLCLDFMAGLACSAVRGDSGWIEETRGILAGILAPCGNGRDEVGVDQIVSLGAPAYNHLLGRVSEESAYALTFFADGMPRLIVSDLSKVVPFGGAPPAFDDFRSDKYARKMLVEASEFLPSRWLGWITYLNRGRAIVARRASRGEYRLGQIKTNSLKTSLHELVHAYEDKPFPSLELKLRSEFYARRTNGKKLRNLGRITNLFFYGGKEKFRAGFIYQYLGKDNGVELMSAGIECLMWNRFDIWNRDPELAKFLLGMLIFFGR